MSEILIGRCGRTQEGQIRINKKSDFPLTLKTAILSNGMIAILILKHLSKTALQPIPQGEARVFLTIVESKKMAL